MKQFNPQHERRILLDSCSFDLAFRTSFEEKKAKNALASNAAADLHMAVYAILVGFNDPARRLLEKAHRWVAEAIETNERPKYYNQFGTEATRFYILAWCNFLLNGVEDSESWRKFFEFEDRYVAEPSTAKDRQEISLLLPFYVSGHAYERALQVLASCRKLRAPESLQQIRGEAQMCYVISRQRLGLEYSDAEVHDALGRFLNRHVDSSWLAAGHSLRAAEWRKIAHWEPGDDPFATVLRCYDYLPYDPPGYPG
jgi:hypothetical protein